ncbi:hypothetical protein [Teichococcus oryzae]|uniref:Uncharacterized protein n=1 Tax=Teichococcus oryzae TaxID=1608942 RepID=A0A5B2TCD4_9PROT|nr:hypothetical protein [Pseudoroseomonas oryzae]KAA2211460.1 hypothetical protein F0Q34_20035 [Pseudoroseomonas oryzae]
MPYGYRMGQEGTLEPVPKQQEAIRRAGELRAIGAPLRTIQATLAAEHGARVSLYVLSCLLQETA